MNIRKRRSNRSGRAPLSSPGRPPVAGEMNGDGSGQRSRQARRVRLLRSGPVCRRRWEQDGSGRQAAWHQRCSDCRRSRSLAGISRLWSGRRLASFARKARPYRRSLVGSDGQHRLSPGSCGATPPPEAAAWSIARRQRNGTPSELLAVQGRRGLRSMRHCKPMWRKTVARSSREVGLFRPCRVVEWPSAWTTARPAVGKRLEPGTDRPPSADRLPGR